MKPHRFKVLKEQITTIYSDNIVNHPIWWCGATFLELTKNQVNNLMVHIAMLEIRRKNQSRDTICEVEYYLDEVFRVTLPSGLIFRRY